MAIKKQEEAGVPYPGNPGFSDDLVLPDRLLGRLAYRAGKPCNAPERGVNRIQWYLGWYDEPLGQFYGRPSPAGLAHWRATA